MPSIKVQSGCYAAAVAATAVLLPLYTPLENASITLECMRFRIILQLSKGHQMHNIALKGYRLSVEDKATGWTDKELASCWKGFTTNNDLPLLLLRLVGHS